jgi:tRNA-specific 2-thiouridylase
MKRVVVGMSGGVDSSVAAYLLKEQGYEVIGMFMKNWHDTSVTISDECPWIDDSNDAMLVAQKLGIHFQTIDLSKQYKERIVDYMFAEYKTGRTPNPDVLCNREIKFDVFLKAAKQLNADFVATGHYCRKEEIVVNGKKVYRLLTGAAPNKDQSYFLCQVNQQQLAMALFPIGDIAKPEVRKIARKVDLITADKKDSQGLCFIGKVKLPDFLQQQLKPKVGEIIEIDRENELFNVNKIELSLAPSEKELLRLSQKYKYIPDDGKIVGDHNGAHYFTIGQRKGLNVGGTPLPLFVIETDTKENIIYVGQGGNHPGLLRPALRVKSDGVHWIRTDLKLAIGKQAQYLVRIRYRQPLQKAMLYQKEDYLFIVFENPQTGIAAGQFVAWYREDELIGSGVID